MARPFTSFVRGPKRGRNFFWKPCLVSEIVLQHYRITDIWIANDLNRGPGLYKWRWTSLNTSDMTVEIAARHPLENHPRPWVVIGTAAFDQITILENPGRMH